MKELSLNILDIAKNSVKADASFIEISIIEDNGMRTLTIRDDGKGFDPAIMREAGHYGLAGMERRATDLGGTMSVTSAPAAGTTLVFNIPC